MPSTRREALAAVGGGLALLAGCAGSESSSSRSVPGDRGKPVPYEYEKVRDEAGDPLFVRAAQTDAHTDSDRSEGDRTTRPPSQPSELVASDDDLAKFEFAPGKGQTLREFAAATDFDHESVFLTGTRIGECFEQRLRGVRIENDAHPRFAFCRVEKPADVECSADRRALVAFAIRIPLPEGATGYGASSGQCNRPERPPTFDPTTTEADR